MKLQDLLLTDKEICEAEELAEIQYFNWISQDPITRRQPPPSAKRNAAQFQLNKIKKHIEGKQEDVRRLIQDAFPPYKKTITPKRKVWMLTDRIIKLLIGEED